MIVPSASTIAASILNEANTLSPTTPMTITAIPAHPDLGFSGLVLARDIISYLW